MEIVLFLSEIIYIFQIDGNEFNQYSQMAKNKIYYFRINSVLWKLRHK